MQYVQQKRTHLNFHQSLSLKEFFDKREICLIPSSVNKIFLFQTQTSKLFKLIFLQGILTLAFFGHSSENENSVLVWSRPLAPYEADDLFTQHDVALGPGIS